MAGSDTGFDPGAFKTAIRTAMTMGLPSATQQQIAFVFSAKSSYSIHDATGRPFDWTESANTTVPERVVRVPAAIQFAQGTEEDNAVGEFGSDKLIVTLLDDDYALVKGFDLVRIGDVTYVPDEPPPPPIGLFSVTVYQIHLRPRG